MRFKTIDCCPAPRALYPILRELKRATGCTFESVYRGTDARKLLNRCGKHDQAYLYEHQGTEGIGPANPPGRSTHELRSDGVAYAGPVGRHLDWWQVGLDVDDAHVERVISAARNRGWIVHQPYPAGSEHHHLNFSRRPARWRIYYHRIFGHKK